MSLKELLKIDSLPVIGIKSWNSAERQAFKFSYDDLLNAESELGRTLFGPIPYGHQREFFESKKNVWIWYESWLDENGAPQNMIIRYEVRPTGVYKRPNDGSYQKIEGDELNNFVTAVRSYFDLVKRELYC